MTGAAIGRLAALVVYGCAGIAMAVWGGRIILLSKQIAERKAIKRDAVSTTDYKAYRIFGQTEEDSDSVRSVTVMQGVSWLMVAALVLYIVGEAFRDSAWK